MEYTLISPTKIIRRKEGPFQAAFEVAIQYQYPILEHDIEIKKPINTFYKSTPKRSHQAGINCIKPLSRKLFRSVQQNIVDWAI
jgi:hypothetical protein